MMKTIKTASALLENNLITSDQFEAIERISQEYAISLSPQLLEVIQHHDPTQAVRKQFIPSPEELKRNPYEQADPIGDFQYSPVKGIVHRYPDRCLLKPISVCPIYCRFCFRRDQIGPKQASLSKKELNDAYTYIFEHPEIWEVILTGGDPCFLNLKHLTNILKALAAIPHVEVIRIHTRIPMVDAKRVTPALVDSLKLTKPVFMVIHANHADEFTPDVHLACARLVDAGIPLLSQTVLLKGINDDPQVLAKLMRTLVKNRIKPYYLHHPDWVSGAHHFRLSLKKGQEIMKALRGHISGLCQPTYVLDIPGGLGKVPVGPNYMTGTAPHYQIEDYQGHCRNYCDPSEEE